MIERMGTNVNSASDADVNGEDEYIDVVCQNLDRLICGVVVIEPKTRAILYVNKAACDMMGRTQLDIKGHRCHQYICPAEENECPILDLGKTVDNSEKLLVTTENERRPILKSVSRVVVAGKDYLLESFVIIEKQKELENELRQLSHHDQLTGLRNRVNLDELVQNEISHAKRFQAPVSIIIFDLDNFKLVNDNQGHLAGDRVLEELSKLLIKRTREVDTVIRWGGDEFLLILPNTTLQNTKCVAEKIATEIKDYDFRIQEKLTTSYGASQYQIDETWDEWFARADEGLNFAKRARKLKAW